MTEFYISVDVETLGGNPYKNPMINLGAVAFTSAGVELGRFTVNLQWPEGYEADADTLKWFQTQNAQAWAVITKDPVMPQKGMELLQSWFKDMCGRQPGAKPVFVFYPTIYDGAWLANYWFKYLGHPTGKGPGFTSLDIRSYAAGKLGIPYAETRKDMPAMKRFMPDPELAPHTHTGLDDAYEQGLLFLNLKNIQ